MLKKLSTIGSSKGLILDKTLLGLLGLEGTGDVEVSLRVEGHRLIVEAPNPISEIRARLSEQPMAIAVDARVDAASKSERAATIRKLKGSRKAK